MTMSQLFNAITERRDAVVQARRQAAGRHRQAGMTLLEIMIVLAIIALVMGIFVGPAVYDRFFQAQGDVATMEMKQLVHQAYPQWSARYRKACPQSLQDLTEYTNKKDVVDPWDNEYKMHCGDSAVQGVRFGVSSMGPDGKEGTEDDVKSWDEKQE